MNMTMQQPLSYPYHMSSSHLPRSAPWPSVPFRLPYPSAPILPQQRFPLSQTIQSFSPYSNVRYANLKRSTSYPNQRPMHPSPRHLRYPIYNDPIRIQSFQPLKAKSISDLQQISQSNSTHLSKAQSWHSMMSHRRSNLSVAYANEMHIKGKHPRKRSPQKKRKVHHHHQPKRRLSSSPPKRKRSFNNQRKRPMPIPQCGVVRISTLDEMPINNNLKNKQNSINNDRLSNKGNSINNDRLSNKGSISNSSKHRPILKDKPKGTNLIQNRTIESNENDDDEGTDMDADTQSSTSSGSHSSLQRRLNNSLRKDPLINAAIEDFREFRRSSSQNTLTVHRHHSRSRDSVCSDSTFHSFSSARSRSDSQSSFTSVERSEIRQLIKTTKPKYIQSIKTPRQPSPSSLSSSLLEPSKIKYSRPTKSIIKPRRSSLTEELDSAFTKLRALDPDQELNYVAPSSICKRKKSIEKPHPIIPPLPTFDELLRQVQLRPVDKSLKSTTPIHDHSKDDIYENPLSSVAVPRSSPIPLYETKPLCETKPEEIKHEYATPIKKVKEVAELQLTYFQPTRNVKNASPMASIISEKAQSRSVSMFSWLTNPIPTTFQPDRISNHQNEYGTPSVKENIYTSDVDVYLPLSADDKNDDVLQMHLDNQTILTDYSYSDYLTKQTTTSTTNLSTILDDFSRLFTRKHEHKNTYFKKTQRCSIM